MTTSYWRVGAMAFVGCVGAFGLSSCSDGGASSEFSKNQAKAPDVGTVQAALAFDGCTDVKRDECTGKKCGCLNGNCQGGTCLVELDGCSQVERDNAAVFGCGCLNGAPSGGSCPALSDGCTDTQRQAAGAFACGCKNGAPFGNFCATPTQDSPAMPIPQVLTPTSIGTTDFYNLTVMPGTAPIRSGARSAIVGYNGSYPGPTIIATKGRQVQVTVTNSWTGATPEDEHKITMHNHGHKVAPTSDGHPVDYILVGGSKTYTYENDQRASTYWYHDHTMDKTASRVFNGLAGFYIIKDPGEDSLNLPSGIAYDVPLMIQDKTMNAGNVLSPAGTVLVGTVNGVSGAHFNVDKHRYRFRILNGSNDRVINLAFTARTFTVIGTDGGLLEVPVRDVSSLSIAPAERYDIVVDFGRADDRVPSTDFLKDTTLNGLKNLLEFRILHDPGPDTSQIKDSLSTIQRWSDPEILQAFARSFDPNDPFSAARNLAFSFDNTSGTWMLNNIDNNRAFEQNRINISSKLNTPYIWMLDNTQGTFQLPHPFHKHLSQFLILDINGVRPDPHSILGGWKDTVNVPAGTKMRIIFKDERFPTDPSCSQAPPTVGTGHCLPFVFHCHNLGHEDRRMMLQETVVQ